MAVNNSLTTANETPTMAQPQTGNAVTQSMVAKEQARIQGQVFMAKQFPRDMTLVMNRITASCERPSLAMISEYEYPKGGQKITGASIRLLEVVAQCYGNVSYSWKELLRDVDNHKSTVLAYAWDLETNLYSELEFDVPHYRTARGKRTVLTDDREIYELVANQASRRVRRCLENVIPRDIVDDAREMCETTMETKTDWAVRINKQIKYFEEAYGVKPQQIEDYFGMSRNAFTSNTFVALTKIYNSVKDGVAKITDYFPKEEQGGTVSNSLKTETQQAKEETSNKPEPKQDLDGNPSLL